MRINRARECASVKAGKGGVAVWESEPRQVPNRGHGKRLLAGAGVPRHLRVMTTPGGSWRGCSGPPHNSLPQSSPISILQTGLSNKSAAH